MSDNPPSFATTAFSGAVVTGGAQLVKIIIQFLSVVVISRLLAPQDFGLVASIMPLVLFVSTFQEMGLQQAVVQRQDIKDNQLNTIFWILSTIGAACFLIVVMLGPVAVWFYDDERLWKLAIVAGLPIIINNFNAIHLSLMNRHLRFKALAVLDVLGATGGFLATLTGALCGLGYWSLMLNPIVMSLIICIGANLMTHWRPSRPSFRLDREVFNFGVNLTGFNLIVFLGRNLDVLLIGRYLGATALGYYDRAQRLISFPLQNLNAPLSRVVLPILCRIQEDKVRLRQVYLRTVGILTLVSVPGIAAVTITAQELLILLLGDKWAPMIPIFWWLGFAAISLPLSSTGSWLFIAQGKTNILFRLGFYTSATVAISFIIGLQWGVVGVAASYAISNYLLRLPVMFWITARFSPVRIYDLIRVQFPLFAAAGVTWLVIATLRSQFEGLPDISLIAIAIICSYTLSLLAVSTNTLGRNTLQEGLSLVRMSWNKISKRNA